MASSLKFPMTVLVDLAGAPLSSGMHEGVISIASVNALVKKYASSTGVPKTISIRIENTRHATRYAFEDIYIASEEEDIPYGEEIRSEVLRRISAKRGSTLDLGTKSLKPCICIGLKLQVQTKNGMPAEHPDAEPKFRVKVRYWNGGNHNVWADYDPDTDELYSNARGKLEFLNNVEVLAAIRELMP